MTRSTIDVCLYTYSSGTDVLWVLVYVDDALIADNSPSLRTRFVADLSARFPTVDKGELAWILHVAITRDRKARSLTMSQSLYVADLLTKYSEYVDESTTRNFDTPLDEGAILSPDDQPVIGSPEHDAMAAKRDVYMSLTGAYLWLSNMTFPELCFASGQLARFLTNPGPLHFAHCIRVLLYLRGRQRPCSCFCPRRASRHADIC